MLMEFLNGRSKTKWISQSDSSQRRKVSSKKPGKRSLPSDFAPEAIPANVKLPKQCKGKEKTKEEQIMEEISAANLGFASISLDCLAVSDQQVRPVQEWFVDTIAKGMEHFTDHSYQPYCVLTKSIMDARKWSADKASGYRYEVIGGQHNLMACQRMHDKYPDKDIFGSRNCQVYLGTNMSFECKAWLGVMNNKVGETRRQSTTMEKLTLCRDLYKEKQKKGESDEEWRKLCLPLTDMKKSSRDFGTLTLMAKAPESIYKRYMDIMKMSESGELSKQSSKGSDAKGGMTSMKLYHFRHINNMNLDAAHAVLDLVIKKKMKLSQLQFKSKEVEQLMSVQAAILGEFNQRGEKISEWPEVETRFPHHMEHEQLISMFGKLPLTTHTPDAIIKWVTCSLQWERDEAAGTLTPDQGSKELKNKQGIKAVLLASDVKVMDRAQVQKACGFMPVFRQCIIDKPEELSLEDLKDVVVWITSLSNQTRQKSFCLIILCNMAEVEKVSDMVSEYEQYPVVNKAYYHVENTTSNGLLTPSVYGMVVANKGTSLTEWKWTNGSSLNFVAIKGDAPYLDMDGLIVDKRQKSSAIYREVMQAATLNHEWILFLDCGIGSGVLECLAMGRNCVAVDPDDKMLDHLRGRFNKVMANQKARSRSASVSSDISTVSGSSVDSEHLNGSEVDEEGDYEDGQESHTQHAEPEVLDESNNQESSKEEGSDKEDNKEADDDDEQTQK